MADKTVKTVELSNDVAVNEVVNIPEIPVIPNSVMSSLFLILETGKGNSDKLSDEQKTALLSYLKPYQGKTKNGELTNYFNIGSTESSEKLHGLEFTLKVPITKVNKKGKIVSSIVEPLLFRCSNIVEGITVFKSGKKAEFSSLSVSAYYRADTIQAIDISF